MRIPQKRYIGPKVRHLREARGWTLEACAQRLGLSTSYLSQIETSQRPVTHRVLIALVQEFEIDAAELDPGDEQRLAADLREASLDSGLGAGAAPLSEIRQAAILAPELSRQFIALHQAYRRLEDRLRAVDAAVAVDEAAVSSARLPYEQVRDYFHYRDNYLHILDEAAEDLSERIGIGRDETSEAALERWLAAAHGISVERTFEAGTGVLRRYDERIRRVTLDATQPASTRAFQLAYQVATLQFDGLIESELGRSGLKGPEARNVCRVGLVNYAAGALLLPYGRFLEAAQAQRHDLERLELRFQASREQVCHRLSTLQRPGRRGTPFYFLRMDLAGNITKRHSATRLQFARFGGTCPLWNIHESFGRPEELLVQLAETPDGVRYLCVATAIVKRAGAFNQPARKYALALGCEVEHASKVVYADGVDLQGPADKVGISCRICERTDCRQRAFPPLDRSIEVPADVREIVPYRMRNEG